MGEVWRARHEELNIDVAVKLALPERVERTVALERFRFEAQVSAQLSRLTPHIVSVHDAGRHEGIPFMVMELVRGRDLDKIIEEEGACPPERVAELVEQAVAALEVAHAACIWHRDIKPGNLMIEPRDGRWQVKLADFGVAKALGGGLDVDSPRTTQTGSMVGTPAFMSPEQVRGEPPTAASDFWSLAVVAYEALTGEAAFDAATTGGVMVAAASKPHRPPSKHQHGLSQLDAFFARALAKDPNKRFASGAELARAFRAAIASKPSRPRLQRWLAIGTVAAIVAIAAMTSIAWWPPSDATRLTPVMAPAAPTPAEAEPPQVGLAGETATATPSSPVAPNRVRTLPSAAPSSIPPPRRDPRAFDPSEEL